MEPIPPPSPADSGNQSRRRLTLVLTTALLLGTAQRAEALSWIIPGVAGTIGANGTLFISDLMIVNAGAADRDVTLSLIPGPATIQPPSVKYTISAGKTLPLIGVLFAVWSVNGTGAIRVTADGPVTLFARTYNLQFFPLISEVPNLIIGAALPVFEEGSLLVPGEEGHSGWVTQSVDPTKGDRTNIAVAFPDEAGGAATAMLLAGDGKVFGTVAFESRESAFLQRSVVAFTAARTPLRPGAADTSLADLAV